MSSKHAPGAPLHHARRAAAGQPRSAGGGGARSPKAPAHAPPQAETELLYGQRSGLAVFERRRDAIRGIGFEASMRSQLRDLVAWAASAGVPCHEQTAAQLAARAQSKQHEGLVLEVLPRRWLPPKELGEWLVAERRWAIALDRVRNPQNIGAILRSAAFFGVDAALLGAPAPHPGLPPFATRVAEGGAEHLRFARTTDLAQTLARLAARGVFVVGADAHAESSVDRVPGHGACVLVLGNEREGLHPRVRSQCHALVGVRGSGDIESLNVAVAAGVLLFELRRRRAESTNA